MGNTQYPEAFPKGTLVKVINSFLYSVEAEYNDTISNITHNKTSLKTEWISACEGDLFIILANSKVNKFYQLAYDKKRSQTVSIPVDRQFVEAIDNESR